MMEAFFNSFVDAHLILGIRLFLLEAFFDRFVEADNFFAVLVGWGWFNGDTFAVNC